jgi:hypothetical protein
VQHMSTVRGERARLRLGKTSRGDTPPVPQCWELPRRIEAAGAADSDVRDMRSQWIMGYLGPDGAAHEAMLERPV